MILKQISSLVLINLFLVSPALALYERTTCANGIVQYTPCTPEQNAGDHVTKTTLKKNSISKSRSVSALNNNVQLTNNKFKPISQVQGLWEGFVSGSGKIHLKLLFIKDGSVLDSKYIGSVTQHKLEKPTKFRFKSPLPSVSGWSWKIVALKG